MAKKRRRQYEGWIWNRQAERDWEDFWSGSPSFTSAAPDLAGATRNKRALLWRSREKYDPGALGKESQTTGDCVSHGSRNARDVTRSVEIDIKGEAERYVTRGATEPTYGARGHGGQGMDPAKAARYERDFGWLIRKNYDDIVNLSRYDSSIGARWGRSGVPKKVKQLCQGYNVGSVIRPRTVEEVLRLLGNGYAGHSGQSWGSDAKTGSDGLNHRTKSWNHDMATVGYDESEEIWGTTVFFVTNSWGSWNRRNTRWDDDALGPWIKGMLVVPIDTYERYFVKSGSIHFYSAINGFPVQNLPDYGFGYV